MFEDLKNRKHLDSQNKLDSGPWTLDLGTQVLGTWTRGPGPGTRALGVRVLGTWTLDPKTRVLNLGTLDRRTWVPGTWHPQPIGSPLKEPIRKIYRK